MDDLLILVKVDVGGLPHEPFDLLPLLLVGQLLNSEVRTEALDAVLVLRDGVIDLHLKAATTK